MIKGHPMQALADLIAYKDKIKKHGLQIRALSAICNPVVYSFFISLLCLILFYKKILLAWAFCLCPLYLDSYLILLFIGMSETLALIQSLQAGSLLAFLQIIEKRSWAVDLASQFYNRDFIIFPKAVECAVADVEQALEVGTVQILFAWRGNVLHFKKIYNTGEQVDDSTVLIREAGVNLVFHI